MGFAMVVANAISTCNFTIVIAWCLYYMYLSMTSDLPWQYCNNDYNTPCELLRGSRPRHVAAEYGDIRRMV